MKKILSAILLLMGSASAFAGSAPDMRIGDARVHAIQSLPDAKCVPYDHAWTEACQARATHSVLGLRGVSTNNTNLVFYKGRLLTYAAEFPQKGFATVFQKISATYGQPFRKDYVASYDHMKRPEFLWKAGHHAVIQLEQTEGGKAVLYATASKDI